MKKYISLLLVLLLTLSITACSVSNEEKLEKEQTTVEEEERLVEQVEDSSQAEPVSPEFDENGNPAGDYAQYLWEQQQMEDAMNSLVEDAMREQYEEDLEPHIFPLD